jgi:hypothetical protein
LFEPNVEQPWDRRVCKGIVGRHGCATMVCDHFCVRLA